MPGTIQVSVLDLVDLPQPVLQSNTSPLSLKVTMGKREYRSLGKGDISFPVTSLREKLIVMLYNVEGNEIFRTEFRIISVVEKGFVEDSYPIKGGGNIHMTLKFLLSHEEHMRIREMRESALKRKRKQMPTAGYKDPASDQSASPVTQLLQVSKEPTEHLFARVVPQSSEVNKETLKIRSPTDGNEVRQISSIVGLDPQSGWSKSVVSDFFSKSSNSTSTELEEDRNHMAKRKILLERNSISKVKKMISAFESNQSQGSSLIRNRSREGSLKRASSEESDINILKVAQTIAKSFSSGMLSDISSQPNPKPSQSDFLNKEKKTEHIGPATQLETIGKDISDLDLRKELNQKNLGSGEEKAIKVTTDKFSHIESLYSTGLHSSSAINNVLDTIETLKTVSSTGSSGDANEGEGLIFIKVRDDPSIMPVARESETKEDNFNLVHTPKMGNTLDADRTLNPVLLSQSVVDLDVLAGYSPDDERNQIRDRRHEGEGPHKQSAIDCPESSHAVKIEAMHTKESKNNEQDFLENSHMPSNMFDGSAGIDKPCNLCTHQQRPSLNSLTKSGDRCIGSHSEKNVVSGASDVAVELLRSSKTEDCPFHDIWMPRHLCITTGSRQLRDLVECCNNCRGIHPKVESSSTPEADEKQQMHGETSILVNKNEKISSISGKSDQKNSLGSLKLNGDWIEQGVRITVVIVACGTLFFNSRQG